jgi:SAM-dependent methyltransferase
MPDFYERQDCRLCRGRNLVRVMTFAPTPPGNQFLTSEEAQHEEQTFPLYVMHCQDCTHLQLGVVVDPRILFQRDYKYVSGTSPVFVNHFRSYAKWVAETQGIEAGALVVDVGSNDGTTLRCFKDLGHRVLGIDPATEIANEATANGIPTVAAFFDSTLARRLRAEHGPAAFVTSHNVCAHVDDLEDLMRGVELLLADDGVLIFEVGYAVDVYDNAWFDTIYHEHLDFHTVRPFVAFFDRLGMVVVDVHRVDVQGGSIRVIVRKKAFGDARVHDRVRDCLDAESRRKFSDPETFRRFAKRIDGIGAELRTLLSGLKEKGRSIAAYGAPTKSTTLLTHFKIARDDIRYIVDDNPKKQGLFSPLLHIPVVSPDVLRDDPPDYLLILAWNFAPAIMAKCKAFAEGAGKFILPMPEAKIV